MSWFKCSGGSGMPSGLQTRMDSVLNKKFGTSTTYPANDWPDDVNLMGMLDEKTTTSASIAHIEDGADGVPVKNWLVTLPASLDGYSEVNGVRTGGNLWNVNAITDTTNPNNATIVNNGNGTITVTTTTQQNVKTAQKLKDICPNIKVGETYFLNVTTTGNQKIIYLHQAAVSWTYGTAKVITSQMLESDVSLYASGTNSTATISDLSLTYGSTATAYSAYEAPTQYTASLGRTIYGGTVDIVTGEGSEDGAIVTLDENGSYSISTGTTTNRIACNFYNTVGKIDGTFASNELTTGENTTGGYKNDAWVVWGSTAAARMWISVPLTIDTVDKFKQYLQNNPITIAYELATPTTFTFTPITPTPETALGVNNFWADEGDSSVTYRSTDTIQPAPTPTLITKNITSNGTYDASSDSADGYSSVEVEVYQGDGGLPITLVATEIATDANQTGTLTFTEDYHDYPILKVRTYHPTNQDYVDIYCTPQFIDDAFAYSSNKANFNRMGTNLYAYYGAGQNDTWVRGGQRTITVTSVFGITSSSHDIEVVNLYRYQSITANNRSVSFSGNTSDYQYLMISMCDGDSTETEPSVPIIPVGNSGIKDLVKYGVGMAYNVTRTFVIEQNAVSDFITTQKYGFFTIDGVNFTPKTAT